MHPLLQQGNHSPESVIRETGEVINDGLHRIFVNTASDDGSDLAVLMSCFTKRMFNNPKFPVFSKRMKELKEDEGGVTAVCEIMQKYEQIAAEEGRKQGREEGFAEAQEAVIRRMLLKQKTPQEIQDLCGFDIAEIEAVAEKLCATV